MLNRLKDGIMAHVRVRRESLSHGIFCLKNGLVGADRIFTHLTMQEKRTLFGLARGMSTEFAIEIGSYLGASSCFLAAGAGPGRKLVCVDTWRNDAMLDEARRETLDEFRKNTATFSERIIEVRGLSGNVAGEVGKIVRETGLLFIDGDHSYEGCRRDADLYLPLVKRGGIVVFHDSGWADTVVRVIDEIRPLLSGHEALPNMFWGRVA